MKCKYIFEIYVVLSIYVKMTEQPTMNCVVLCMDFFTVFYTAYECHANSVQFRRPERNHPTRSCLPSMYSMLELKLAVSLVRPTATLSVPLLC